MYPVQPYILNPEKVTGPASQRQRPPLPSDVMGRLTTAMTSGICPWSNGAGSALETNDSPRDFNGLHAPWWAFKNNGDRPVDLGGQTNPPW